MTARHRAALALALAGLTLRCAEARAQHLASTEPGAATVRAVRLGSAPADAIRVDGLLDEPAWQRAQPATGFRQMEPAEGAAASEDTEVRVLYDGTTLYIGVLALDREPDRGIARILQRDRVMEVDFLGRLVFAGDDGVAIILDPFHDHRSGVVFATNPNGAEFDALVTDEGREVNVSWRGIWTVAARRTQQGWSAEFAIPFRTLRYAAGDAERPWGLNVYRMIQRKNEQVLWTAWSRANEGLTRLSRAGHLTGLADLPHGGLNVEVKPYALGGASDEADTTTGVRSRDATGAAGLDLKYEVRPGLVLDGTLKTDFAQVEADDEQVNLTRFSLFYPEKRDFFLENAGVFEFGVRGLGEPPPFLMFFSRRIGISDSGEVKVLGGARLTGRAGHQTIGLLDVVTDAAYGSRRTNVAVLRVKRDIGASNYLGAMLTDRRSADSTNTVGGVDWSYWPAGPLNVQGFVARTETRGPGGDDWAYRLGIDYQTGPFGVTGQHLVVGPDIQADAGFVTRTDIRRTNGYTRVSLRPAFLGIRRVDVFVTADVVDRVDGQRQDRSAGAGVWPQWNSGAGVALFVLRGSTRLDEAFDLADSVPVPVGDYRTWQIAANAATSRANPVFGELAAQRQHIYDGSLTTVSGTVSAAAGSHVNLSAGFTRNRVELPAGSFTADLAKLRLGIAFSTRLFANALVQFDGLARTVSANVRINYIYRPGSDLFLVFNEERGSRLSTWGFRSRGVRVKVTYLARL